VKLEVAQGADLTASPATWVWADATAITYTRDPITINRGRPDESATADSCQLDMTGDNRGGHWSTRNPNSPWYGLVRKGTPIRVAAEGYPRFSGFLSELPPRWDLSGNDRYAPVVARGLLYRLMQGASPERSALARTILASNPVAYWPLEDAAGATQGASAIGGAAMAVIGGEVDFGVFTDLPGGSVAPDMTAGYLQGTVTGASSTSWHTEFAVSGFSTSLAVIARIYTSGALTNVWRFAMPTTAGDPVQVFIDDFAGAGPVITLLGPTATADWDLEWHHIAVTAEQVASSMVSKLYVDGVLYATDTTAGTLGAPTAVLLNHNYTFATMESFAHVAVGNGTTPVGAPAMSAYSGEQAHTRFLRLCAEEGIAASTGVTESQAMGPQGVHNAVDLFRECEATDSAYLYEGVNFDLIFQGHNERQNMPVSLALNYAASGHIAPPLEPTDDDQQAHNDVEVKRDGGSSYRATETDAAVENSIPNIGRRDTSVTLSLYDDSQPQQAAGWRLRQGTWPGYRFPTVSLNLAAAPSLIPTVCAAGLAYRATIANPPSDIGPDAPDLIVEGSVETLDQYDWDIAANCSPYGPWRVLTLALDGTDPNPLIGRDDWDSCLVAVDSGATVTVNVSPLITTDPTEFPFNVRCLGELATVTNCSGSSSPQTLTLTRAVNGISKTWTAGAVVELVDALVLTL